MMLMNKNSPVLEFSMNRNLVSNVKVMNEFLLPEMLKTGNEVAMHEWLKNRSVDLTRTNARLLLKFMRININDISTVLANKALCLTDGYWIREVNNYERFEDLSLYRQGSNRMIIQTSLSGARHTMCTFPEGVNPELTNIGSYNKAWIKSNNYEWWLLKVGKPKNIYAELFTYHLGSHLGMDMAEYKYDQEGILSKNFTNEDIALEHFHSFQHGMRNHATTDLEIAEGMGEFGLYEDYTNMLLMDALVCNPDRHEFNFGILKDSNDGRLLKLAPNFDNNMALGAESGISTYLMKEYLKDFGIPLHQRSILYHLNLDLIHNIDNLVKQEMRSNLDTSYIIDYFVKILKILREY